MYPNCLQDYRADAEEPLLWIGLSDLVINLLDKQFWLRQLTKNILSLIS